MYKNELLYHNISYFVEKLVLINVTSTVEQFREDNGQFHNRILSTAICEDKGKLKQFGNFLYSGKTPMEWKFFYS